MRSIWITGLALASLLAMGGCSVKKPPKAAVPGSATPGVATLPSREEALEAGSSGAAEAPAEAALNYERVVVPPLHPAEPEERNPAGEDTEAQTPTESKPRPVKRPAATASPKAPEAEAPAEADPAKVNDLPAPALKPMLSDAERRQLDGLINTNLDRAPQNSALIREGRLGTNERSVLEEARSFAARADQLRRSDPALANSLAERAAILTQELLRKQ